MPYMCVATVCHCSVACLILVILWCSTSCRHRSAACSILVILWCSSSCRHRSVACSILVILWCSTCFYIMSTSICSMLNLGQSLVLYVFVTSCPHRSVDCSILVILCFCSSCQFLLLISHIYYKHGTQHVFYIMSASLCYLVDLVLTGHSMGPYMFVTLCRHCSVAWPISFCPVIFGTLHAFYIMSTSLCYLVDLCCLVILLYSSCILHHSSIAQYVLKTITVL